jgi:HEAT repeat protein
MSTNEGFNSALARLRDTSQPVPMASLYHLSDLAGADLTAFEAFWPELSTERRAAIVQNLQEISEANFEVSFDAVFRLALEDESPESRAVAIRALWDSEDPTLMAPLIDFMLHDPDPLVRAAAASGLGRYVYLGELEELPAAQVKRVEDNLLAVINGDDELEVRRRALEALAYSDRPEVASLIAKAYASDEAQLRVSAMFAMGRTADGEWAPQVRAEMKSSEPEMRFEAVRAAGELELTDAAQELADLTDDDDHQVREAAIWSLGQVGGEVALNALTQLLEQAEDEDMQDFIEEAMENLQFTNEVAQFSLLEFGPDGDEDDELDLDDDLAEDDDEDLPA